MFQGSGMLLGYGRNRYPEMKNTSLTVPLTESGWYHTPPYLFDIEASAFRGVDQPQFIGGRVTKNQFMQVLGSIDRLLVLYGVFCASFAWFLGQLNR